MERGRFSCSVYAEEFVRIQCTVCFNCHGATLLRYRIPLVGTYVYRARCCGAGNIRFTSDGQVFLGEPFDGFVHPASLLCRLICLLQASRSSGDV